MLSNLVGTVFAAIISILLFLIATAGLSYILGFIVMRMIRDFARWRKELKKTKK